MYGAVVESSIRNMLPFPLKGLKYPECQGYGSARLAVVGSIGIRRGGWGGRVDVLKATSARTQPGTGIVHSRWATHGVPSGRNANRIEETLKSDPDLFTAVRLGCERLIGAYAITVIDHQQPGKVMVAREGSPLLVGVSGLGNHAGFDASAMLDVTRNGVCLENGDITHVTAAHVRIARLRGSPADQGLATRTAYAD